MPTCTCGAEVLHAVDPFGKPIVVEPFHKVYIVTSLKGRHHATPAKQDTTGPGKLRYLAAHRCPPKPKRNPRRKKT
jgi:hypothetical protein